MCVEGEGGDVLPLPKKKGGGGGAGKVLAMVGAGAVYKTFWG